MHIPGMQEFLGEQRERREKLQNAVPRRSASVREIVLIPSHSLKGFADVFRQMVQQCWGNQGNIPCLAAESDDLQSISEECIDDALSRQQDQCGAPENGFAKAGLVVDVVFDARTERFSGYLDTVIAAATEGLTGAFGGSADGLVVQIFSVIASGGKKDRAKINQYLRELDCYLRKTGVRTVSYLFSTQDASLEQVYLAAASTILLYNTNFTIDNAAYQNRFFDYSGPKGFHVVPGIRAVTTNEADIYMTGLLEVLRGCLQYFREEADIPPESKPWDSVYRKRMQAAGNAGKELVERLAPTGIYLPRDDEKLRRIAPGRHPIDELEAVFFHLTEMFYRFNAQQEERAAETLPTYDSIRGMCGSVRLSAAESWLAQARQSLDKLHSQNAGQVDHSILQVPDLAGSADERRKALAILGVLLEVHRARDSAGQLERLRDEQREIFNRAENLIVSYDAFLRSVLQQMMNGLEDTLRGFRGSIDHENIAAKAKERYVAVFYPYLRGLDVTQAALACGSLLNGILREYERGIAGDLLAGSADFFARIMQETSQGVENAAAGYLDSVLPMCRFVEIFTWGDETEYAVLANALEPRHQRFIKAICEHKNTPYICQVGGASLFLLMSFTKANLENLMITQ